ncbi:ATP-binding protein [Streptomyces sp. NPDC014724]|uniref:ATP-binding protein n=1 Tax=unclassified Streptomyces TaxID=2593676 RepID=UPI0036F8D088
MAAAIRERVHRVVRVPQDHDGDVVGKPARGLPDTKFGQGADVRHGHVRGRDFHLRLEVPAYSQTVRIAVTDARAERVPPRPDALLLPGGADSGGRGLLLVGRLAARWDRHLRSEGPGKTVWAECALTLPRDRADRSGL